jgi:hypothetical protein
MGHIVHEIHSTQDVQYMGHIRTRDIQHMGRIVYGTYSTWSCSI